MKPLLRLKAAISLTAAFFILLSIMSGDMGPQASRLQPQAFNTSDGSGFILLSILSGVFFVHPACALENSPAVSAILHAAESMFIAMKERDYTFLWQLLTTKTRNTIIEDTDNAIRRHGGKPVSREELLEDFATGGPIAHEYWEGFLRRFNPDDALEKSRWKIGAMEKDRAEVLITHSGADRPATLQMLREKDGWKAGLAETFWKR